MNKFNQMVESMRLKLKSNHLLKLIILLIFLTFNTFGEDFHISKEKATPRQVTLDFQNGFNETEVECVINSITILNETLTTNPVLGWAKTAILNYRDSELSFILICKKLGIRNSFNIPLSKGSFIGISLKKNQFSIEQSHSQFLYD